MRPRRLLSTSILIGLLVIGLVGAGAGLVAAQQSPDAPGPDRGSDSATSEQSSEVVTEVDRQVRVTNYSYSEEDEIMAVELEHVDPGGSTARLTLTELIEGSSGSGTFGVEQLRLRPGETATVEVDVRMRSGTAGVMIVTQRSLQNGNGAFVTTGSDLQLFEGPASWQDVRVGVLVGVGVTMLGTLLVSWRVVARKDSSYQEVELT